MHNHHSVQIHWQKDRIMDIFFETQLFQDRPKRAVTVSHHLKLKEKKLEFTMLHQQCQNAVQTLLTRVYVYMYNTLNTA